MFVLREVFGFSHVEIADGLITHFYAMRNPDKLRGVKVAREITRDLSV